MYEPAVEQSVEVEKDLAMLEMQVLIMHLLRSQQVMNAAIGKLLPEHLDQPQDIPFQLIWSIASHYYLQFRELVPQSILRAEISSHMLQEPAYAQFSNIIWDTVGASFAATAEQLAAEPVIKIYLQRLLNVRVFKTELAKLSQMAPEDAFNHMRSVFERSRLSVAKKVKLFDVEDAGVVEEPIIPVASGSAVFDKLTKGGIRAKHVTGVLAPYGGGKTLLQLEVAVNCAKQRIPVIYAAYEQSPMVLRPRVQSCASGLSTTMLTEKRFSELSEDAKQKLRDLSYMDDYLHVLDMTTATTGAGGARELLSVIQEYASRGFKPQLVCVDWLGIMVDRFFEAQGKTDSYDKINVYKNALTCFRYDIANAMECEVFVSHQLNADAGKRGPNSRASMYDAADFKSFAALMDTCLVVSTKAANGIATVGTAKNRGLSDEVNVRVQGDLCKFDIVGSGFMAIQTASGQEILVDPNSTGAQGGIQSGEGGLPGFD